ncbi:MAG: hypothetical protein QOD06_1535 [Candidatus Binatota bacterium]|nr:hypothetical protein [Candidatus Binatota bacterium]
MTDAPDKVRALVDTVRILRELGARHALIGGVAVGVHSGVARATVDTDVAVRSDVDRAATKQAMIAAGFRLTGEFPHSTNFRHRSGEPVQLVFDVEFDPMIDRAESFDAAGTPVPIVSKVDLIAMKLRSGSDPSRRRSKALRDQADVELLLGDEPDPDEGW